MRYSREHKDKARQRLLDTSANHAKEHGFAASGVDALAAAAGVTTGSLYKHFDGKADLFASLIRAELQRTAERFANIPPGDADAAEKVMKAYLSLKHLRQPDEGCPLPTLTAEVARADDEVRRAYDDGLRDVFAQLAPIAGSSAKAWALISLSVGAVLIARASLDPAIQRELLDSARAEARALLNSKS